MIVGQPLYYIIKKPYDSALLLGMLGFYPEEHKDEMGCIAHGLNPRILNSGLTPFVEGKIKDIPSDNAFSFSLESNSPPSGARYEDEIENLKLDPKFMKEVFEQ